MTGISNIMQPELQALPASSAPLDGLCIQITSEEIRAILSARIDRLQDELDKAKAKIERKKKFAEQFNEQESDDKESEEDIKVTRLLENNKVTIENNTEMIKLLIFVRDHTPLNQVFWVKWDDFTSSWLDPRR